MYQRPLFLIALVCALPFPAPAQEHIIEVGLMNDLITKKMVIMVDKSSYAIKADGVQVYNLQPNDGLRIELKDGVLQCRTLQRTFSASKRLEFVRRTRHAQLRLKALDSKMLDRAYSGDLVIRIKKNDLDLIGHIPIEEYVAGVVQAEAGLHKHPEYYKLQAVSSRTYALTNFRKHAADGYQVCDDVHCQVYKGCSISDTIDQAVIDTRNMVIVDPDIQLIHTTFHSNCGGETSNSEDVWTKPVPYLRAVADTFCLSSPHAKWRKELTKQQWLDYLTKNYKMELKNKRAINSVLHYDPGCRDLYLANVEPYIPLLQVRKDLALNSIYFTVHPEGDEKIVLEGKGFGHGVGMCQEGAMRMAEAKYDFNDILHFYYTGVHLVNLSTLDFFREEGP